MVQSRVHETVLTIAWEKQSESNAMWALSLPMPFSTSVNAGAGGYFSPIMRRYMAMSGAPELIGCMVAFKDRQHALRNPLRPPASTRPHLRSGRRVADAVGPDPLLETCPSSDGACAMVMTNEAGGDTIRGRSRGSRAPQCGRSRTPTADATWCRPPASEQCADDVFAQAGIHDRRKEIDVVEMYVPFSWYEPMWLESLGFAEKGPGLAHGRGRIHELRGR